MRVCGVFVRYSVHMCVSVCGLSFCSVIGTRVYFVRFEQDLCAVFHYLVHIRLC